MGGIVRRLIDERVIGDELDAVIFYVDLFYGGVEAVDEDDANVSAFAGFLLPYNDDVAFFDAWRHAVSLDAESEVSAAVCHFGCDFFPVDDVIDGFDGDASGDVAQDGDADGFGPLDLMVFPSHNCVWFCSKCISQLYDIVPFHVCDFAALPTRYRCFTYANLIRKLFHGHSFSIRNSRIRSFTSILSSSLRMIIVHESRKRKKGSERMNRNKLRYHAAEAGLTMNEVSVKMELILLPSIECCQE